MKTQIKVPAVGESITEGTIAQWSKKNGESVKRDEVVLVLETDKASVEVVAEADGVLTTQAKVGDVVKIGSVVGVIDSDGAATGAAAGAGAGAGTGAAASTGPKAGEAGNAADEKDPSSTAKVPNSAAASAGAVSKGNSASPAGPKSSGTTPSKSETMSPAVRRVVSENNLDPEAISGSGKDGRLTKSDAVTAANTTPASKSTGVAASAAPAGSGAPASPKKHSTTDEIVREPMTTIRKRIAQRLVEAQSTAAILTTFNEIDMSQLMALRTKYKEKFEKKYGVGLGFMGFFVRAVIEALRAYPRVNAFIDGGDVVYHNYYNIGVAVGTEKGLMVPVLKHAENLSLSEIELSIKSFAQKARDGKISVDDLNGGTFTISNGGVYGSLMSTPILNPPQSGILGMHKIEERPIALNGQVVIRPMMYVALSYDHRMVDGGESVSFLVRVKDCIEDPARLLLEI